MSQSCCIPCQSKAVCTKYGCFEKQFLEMLSKTVQNFFFFERSNNKISNRSIIKTKN